MSGRWDSGQASEAAGKQLYAGVTDRFSVVGSPVAAEIVRNGDIAGMKRGLQDLLNPRRQSSGR